MDTINCLINDHFFHRMDHFIFSNSKLEKACFNQLARDAEDMVQDLFISMHGFLNDNIQNFKSYLSKMMVNRCLNELKSARNKRISYVGNWLPEPTVQLIDHSPLVSVELQDTMSYAL